MSQPASASTLCKRCSLLSFDDLAIGGRETVDSEGFPCLSLKDARIQLRPEFFEIPGYSKGHDPDYTLVRLAWHLEDTLPHMPDLSHSSNHGCEFCSALRPEMEAELAKAAKSYTIHDGPLTVRLYLSLVNNGIEGLLVEGDHNQQKGIVGTCQIFFPIEAAPHDCEKWLGTGPARESNYLNPINVREMSRLLQRCATTCHPWEPSEFVPTRLIDVGEEPHETPRLVSSFNFPPCQRAKYAALSYCWGTGEDAKTQFKTERSSLEARHQGLPLPMMTAAIRDAVALTRAVGLRFVWIDALCIIQDDIDDWQHESSQMNLVYRHAFVTFCGLNSRSCHQTLLERAPALKVFFQSRIRRDVSGYYLIRLHSARGPWRNREKLDDMCTWQSRAWTLQEMELSTRLLLFGRLKMHFRCGGSEWSEGEAHSSTPSNGKVFDQIARINQGHGRAVALYDTWLYILHGYCHRALTLKKDRLPAISGLASIIGDVLKDQYLAGVWRGDIHRGLCWSSGSRPECRGLQNYLHTIQSREYIAPSWSWASTTTASSVTVIVNHEPMIEANIVDVHIVHGTENPLGQVTSGFIRLRGKVGPMPTSFLPIRDGEQWESGCYEKIDGEEGIWVSLDWLCKDEEPEFAGLVVLPLLRQDQDVGADVVTCLYGLILYPASGSNQYYRVGMLSSDGLAAAKIMRSWFEGSREETICII